MPKRKRGLLIIISGPSGAGKGTICSALIKRHEPHMKFSISATTRPRRAGETEQDYVFITKDEFEKMIQRGEFLEHMQLFGNHYYGTPKARVNEERDEGNDILLEIDVNGAMMVKSACPDALLVFIAPPSMAELRSRLTSRGTETFEDIDKRTQTALKEMMFMQQYEYVVINDVLEKAVVEVSSIVEAEKHRVNRNLDFIDRIQREKIL